MSVLLGAGLAASRMELSDTYVIYTHNLYIRISHAYTYIRRIKLTGLKRR